MAVIIGNAPMRIGSDLFMPSCIKEGSKVLVENIDQVLLPTFV